MTPEDGSLEIISPGFGSFALLSSTEADRRAQKPTYASSALSRSTVVLQRLCAATSRAISVGIRRTMPPPLSAVSLR